MLRLVPKVAPPMACRIVPLTHELLQLALAMAGDEEVAAMADSSRALALYLTPGLSFAVLDGGMLVACLGLVPVRATCAQAWMIRSPSAVRRQMAFVVRRTIEYWAGWQKDAAYRRIEWHVRDGEPWREAFAARLGATECFGPLKAWDRLGRSYWQYARVA